MTEAKRAAIDVEFAEDDAHTEATATARTDAGTFVGQGRARRNPADPNVPVIGEELALARALSDLSHKLMEAAAEVISDREGKPVHLRG